MQKHVCQNNEVSKLFEASLLQWKHRICKGSVLLFRNELFIVKRPVQNKKIVTIVFEVVTIFTTEKKKCFFFFTVNFFFYFGSNCTESFLLWCHSVAIPVQ